MSRRWATGSLLILLCTPALAAPLTSNTALPVAKGEFVAREQILVRERERPDDATVEVNVLISVLGYGVTPDLAVFGVLPLLDKTLTPPTGPKRSTEGQGDLTLFGRYTLWREDMPGRTARIAALGGVIAPTGDDDDRDNQGRLPRPFQNGTGAWGGLAGIVATWQTLDYQLDGQLVYRGFGSDEAYRPGDVYRFDISLQYRLWPKTLTRGTPGFLYALIEANVIQLDRDVLSGARLDTGGTQWFLTPGIQYVTKRWIVEGGVQLPVEQDRNGNAFADEYIARVGLRFNF